VTAWLGSRRMGAARWLVLVGSVAGCSASGTPASRAASDRGPCTGQAYVEVRNDLPVSVDVFAYVGGTPMYLGSVSPGKQRLPVFQPVGYIYAERDGRRVSSRRAASSVSFTRVCEPS
jgi:hypothetical protein